MNILPAIVIFVGALINAIAAFWISWKQDRSNSKIAIAITAGTVISAFGVLWTSQQQAGFERELVDSIIGGDSFCYLTVGNIDSVKNIGQFVLLHEGKHPLYDVHVRIHDLDKFDQIKRKPSFATQKQTDTNISLGTLAPSSARMLYWITLGDGGTRRFTVEVSARNGFLGQALRLKKIDGKWVRATRVTRGWDKVIYEEINDKFPRTARGDVEW